MHFLIPSTPCTLICTVEHPLSAWLSSDEAKGEDTLPSTQATEADKAQLMQLHSPQRCVVWMLGPQLFFFFFLTLQTHSYCTAWLTNVDIAFLPPNKSSERAQKNWKTFAHTPPWGDPFRLVVPSKCRDVTPVLFLTIPALSCLLQDTHTGIQISKDLTQYQLF